MYRVALRPLAAAAVLATCAGEPAMSGSVEAATPALIWQDMASLRVLCLVTSESGVDPQLQGRICDRVRDFAAVEADAQGLPVLDDPLGGLRLRDHHGTALQVPRENDLRRRRAVLLGDAGQDALLEEVRPVAQRRPGLVGDALLPAVVEQLALLEEAHAPGSPSLARTLSGWCVVRD